MLKRPWLLSLQPIRIPAYRTGSTYVLYVAFLPICFTNHATCAGTPLGSEDIESSGYRREDVPGSSGRTIQKFLRESAPERFSHTSYLRKYPYPAAACPRHPWEHDACNFHAEPQYEFQRGRGHNSDIDRGAKAIQTWWHGLLIENKFRLNSDNCFPNDFFQGVVAPTLDTSLPRHEGFRSSSVVKAPFACCFEEFPWQRHTRPSLVQS